jgi:integrase/recombinase XerD
MGISLDRAREGFKLANQVANKSPKTVKWYDAILIRFIRWLKEEKGGDDVELADRDTLRAYVRHLQSDHKPYEGHPFHQLRDGKLSPATVRGHFATLSAFFNWMVAEELIADSPMKNVPRPKVPKLIKPVFTQTDVAALLKACDTLPRPLAARSRAIVLFLLDTGARASEAMGLQMPELDIERGRALIMGKGAKQRYVYLGKNSRRALWQYVSLYRPEPIAGVDNVFLTMEGHPIRIDRLAKMLKQLGDIGGVENVHPHRFRRTAAVQFLRNPGSSVLSLQKMLGHESLEMVRHYADLAAQDVEVAHRTASPVDNWDLR